MTAMAINTVVCRWWWCAGEWGVGTTGDGEVAKAGLRLVWAVRILCGGMVGQAAAGYNCSSFKQGNEQRLNACMVSL